MKIIKLLPSVLLVLFLVPAVAEVDAQSDIKIFSMNLHCFEEHWQERFNTILKVVAQKDIDVYAFQELCIGEGQDQVAFLLRHLQELHPESWTSKSLFTHKAWDRYGEYLLIVARGNELPVRAAMLPDSPLPRGFAAVRVGDTWFVNTHLEYHEDNAAYRLKQLEYLVDEFNGQAHVLMGDFNSSPGMDEQRPLKKAGYEAYFPGPTFPALKPESGIDGFWISPLQQEQFSNTIVTRLFGPGLAGGVQSDHLGVLLEAKSISED